MRAGAVTSFVVDCTWMVRKGQRGNGAGQLSLPFSFQPWVRQRPHIACGLHDPLLDFRRHLAHRDSLQATLAAFAIEVHKRDLGIPAKLVVAFDVAEETAEKTVPPPKGES